jgi:acetyltransferase
MARVRPLRGERLAIVGNGQGLGRIAAGTLLKRRHAWPGSRPETAQKLAGLMRTGAAAGNPLALPPDLSPAQLDRRARRAGRRQGIDAVLTVYSPSPFASGNEVAAAIGAAAAKTAKNIFSCWVGGSAMQEAQQVAAAKGLLAHDSPEKAIGVFLGIVNYERNRELLLQMPPSVAEEFVPDLERARDAVAEALAAGARCCRRARRASCCWPTASNPGTPCRRATSMPRSPPPTTSAIRSTSRWRWPAMPSTRWWRASCVRRRTSASPCAACAPAPASRISRRARQRLPPAAQRRAQRPAAAAPGRGRRRRVRAGDLPRRIRRRPPRNVVALPPLNRRLAMDLVTRGGFAREAAEEERDALETGLATALVRLSQLLTDIDEVTAIELDPIHVETSGVVARERHIHVEPRGRHARLPPLRHPPLPARTRTADRLARQEAADPADPAGGRNHAGRPDRLARPRGFAHALLRHHAQAAALAAGALYPDRLRPRDRAGGHRARRRGVERSLGEARMVADPDNAVAEFAILVASDVKGGGLGRRLMESLIDCARNRGIGELRGETLSENTRMQDLARKLGFELKTGPGVVEMRLTLHPPAA